MALETKSQLRNKITQQGALIKQKDSLIKSISLSSRDFFKVFGFTKKDDNNLTDPYKQLPTVYSCIRAKAKNLAQVPFRLYQGEKEVTSGQVYELFQSVNPYTQR